MDLFDWDDANLLHIAQHDLTAEEVEYALTHDPLDLDTQVLESEERLVQVGTTGRGKVLLVISVSRGEVIRVVTAFNASRRYRLLFEDWRRGNNATET